jgi:hypothetical protein
MFATVTATRAAPPTTGLVASAPPAADDGARWESGLAWVPERCGIGYQLVPWCSDTDPAVHQPTTTGAAYYRPVGARFAVSCSTLGGGVDPERVRRMVEATSPFVVARELWDGALGQTEPFTIRGEIHVNARLADPSAEIVGTGGAELLFALGRLEQAAVEASMGQRVMLHLPVRLTSRLGDFARRVGADLLTRSDNLVVADAGYPGTGPTGQAVGATAWAYASTLAVVRQSRIEVVDDPAATVDRAVNTATVWAERMFAATFDPCVHFATQINT